MKLTSSFDYPSMDLMISRRQHYYSTWYPVASDIEAYHFSRNARQNEQNTFTKTTDRKVVFDLLHSNYIVWSSQIPFYFDDNFLITPRNHQVNSIRFI